MLNFNYVLYMVYYLYVYVIFDYMHHGNPWMVNPQTVARAHTDGQGPGEMGELIDAPAGAEKLKGMRQTAGASAAGWWI